MDDLNRYPPAERQARQIYRDVAKLVYGKEIDEIAESVAIRAMMRYDELKNSATQAVLPIKKTFMVEFYRDITTRDQYVITVEANSSEEAIQKVKDWGLGTKDLSDAEIDSEVMLKEGEVQTSAFVGFVTIFE